MSGNLLDFTTSYIKTSGRSKLLAFLFLTLISFFAVTRTQAQYPVVAGTATSFENTTETIHDISLPPGIQPGDLIIVFWADGASYSIVSLPPPGWDTLYFNTIFTPAPIFKHHQFFALYKIADGTEGAVLQLFTDNGERSAHNSYRISAGSYTGNPVAGILVTGNSQFPDPPLLISGFGAVPTLWLATSHSSGNVSSPFPLPPANYVNLISGYTGSSASGHARMLSARRFLDIAAENPDPFNLWSLVTWGANTVAIKGSQECYDAILTLTSAPGTDDQTVCANQPITPITYEVDGSATGATTTGLPAGVSGAYNAGVYTINGAPTVSGVFNYTVTTTGTPAPCLEDTIYGTLEVLPLPGVSCSGISYAPVCEDAPAFTLSGATPAGGTYSGPGVSGGIFDPSVAGPGIHTITYSYTDPGTGCSNQCNFTITVNALPIVTCPDDIELCIDADPMVLTGGSPAGGNYSGPGVSLGIFNPSAAGAGTHTITYSYTDGNNCSNHCTFTISVYELPVVTCPAGFDICLNASPVTLSGGNPAGGIYSGPGVSGGIFDPGTAGVGPHTITYTYTDGYNCTNSCTFTIIVFALPVVTCPASFAVCCDDDAITLSSLPGISPAGGTFSGAGVVGGIFTPSCAFTGAKTITYSYTDGNGCENSCTFVITVNPLPVVTCPANFAVCCDDDPIALSSLPGVSPAGGTFTGEGVAGGIFTPSCASTGAKTITYAYTDGNGCENSCIFVITVHPLPVVTCPPSISVCINDSPFALTGGAPAGGSYSGPGVSGGTFNPAAAGAGTHSITYTYTDPSTGCTNTCTFTITVKPIPVGWASPQTICSGETTAVLLNSNLPNTTFTWTAQIITPPPGGTITGFSDCNAACGNLIQQTLVNTTMSYPTPPPNSGPGVIRYTITPVADGCVGNPFTVNVTINPIPQFWQNHTISWNSNFQQDLMEICAGGSILNDNDIDILPPPSSNYFNVPNWSVLWEYSDSPTGPWIPAPGYMIGNYQWVLSSEIFTTLGIYYFRFTVTNQYGCPSSSNQLELHVISTLTVYPGGPDFLCMSGSPSPHTLEGAYVGGVANTPSGGTWSITSLNPPNGGNNGTLFPTGFQTNPSIVTYTPPANYSGTVTLTLTSNDPGSGCEPVTEERTIHILADGAFEGCFAPENLAVVNNPPSANGYLDDESAPCQVTLVGSDHEALSGTPATTDVLTCADEGIFSFDWYFAAPENKPVWHTEDQKANYGSGTTVTVNGPNNINAGDLIIVTIHSRRPQTNNITQPAGQGFIQIAKTIGTIPNTTYKATVASFYKIASATEPNTYTFYLPTGGSYSHWRALAGRVTGHDGTNPIGQSQGATVLNSPPNWRVITIGSVTTTTDHSLLIAALSVVDIVQFPNSPEEMTTFYYFNGTNSYRTVARVAKETRPTAGATGSRSFYWPRYGSVNPYAYSSAAQMFVINAPDPAEVDAAYYLIDGNTYLLSEEGGQSGSVSVPVSAGTEIGFRVSTSTNSGGRGKLTIYNLQLEDPVPVFASCPAEPIELECNAQPTVNDALGAAGSPNDVCYDDFTITTDSTVSQIGCEVTKTYNIIAENGCGNSDTCQVSYTWTSDTEPPVIACPYSTPQTVPVNLGNQYMHSGTGWDATATDNCGLDELFATLSGATISGPHASLNGVIFNQDTTTVTWTAVDSCGNHASCSFDVIVLGQSDVAVLKTGPATITAGQDIAWTITVTNGGPAVAEQVTLTDIVPPQVTGAQYSTDGGINWAPWPGSLVMSDIAVGAPGTQTILLAGTVSCDATDFSNTATVALAPPLTDPDPNNNTSTVNTTIINPLQVTAIVTNAPCPDEGAIDITVTGGTAPYSFTWTGPNGFVSNSEDLTGLSSGNYAVVVTDGNGCTVSGDWDVVSEDILPPEVILPGPLVFCVYDIYTANYNWLPEPDADIEPDRPDWYIINGTELDIVVSDNCCAPEDIIINWTITFGGVPAQAPVSGSGQPSLSVPITLWGTTNYVTITNTITYTVEDCNGNVLLPPLSVDIEMQPRPNVIKQY